MPATAAPTKTCPRCSLHLPLTSYSVDNGRADGLNLYCSGCHSKFNAEWRRSNPEKVAAHNRARRQRNQVRNAARRASGWDPHNPTEGGGGDDQECAQ